MYSVMETINDLPCGWGVGGGGEGNCLVYKFHLRGSQRSLQFKEGDPVWIEFFSVLEKEEKNGNLHCTIAATSPN